MSNGLQYSLVGLWYSSSPSSFGTLIFNYTHATYQQTWTAVYEAG